MFLINAIKTNIQKLSTGLLYNLFIIEIMGIILEIITWLKNYKILLLESTFLIIFQIIIFITLTLLSIICGKEIYNRKT